MARSCAHLLTQVEASNSPGLHTPAVPWALPTPTFPDREHFSDASSSRSGGRTPTEPVKVACQQVTQERSEEPEPEQESRVRLQTAQTRQRARTGRSRSFHSQHTHFLLNNSRLRGFCGRVQRRHALEIQQAVYFSSLNKGGDTCKRIY